GEPLKLDVDVRIFLHVLAHPLVQPRALLRILEGPETQIDAARLAKRRRRHGSGAGGANQGQGIAAGYAFAPSAPNSWLVFSLIHLALLGSFPVCFSGVLCRNIPGSFFAGWVVWPPSGLITFLVGFLRAGAIPAAPGIAKAFPSVRRDGDGILKLN